MAATRWLCLASMAHGNALAVPLEHVHQPMAHAQTHVQDSAHNTVAHARYSAHDTAAHAHHTAAHDAAHAASGSDNAPLTPVSGDRAHHDASGSCQLCAACCLTVASPPAPPTLAMEPLADAGFPPVSAPVPHNVADGPERPPRSL
jgi:hypothetical protein